MRPPSEPIENGLKWSAVKVFARTIGKESSNWRMFVRYWTRTGEKYRRRFAVHGATDDLGPQRRRAGVQ